MGGIPLDDSIRSQLTAGLKARQEPIAAAWYAAIAPTGHVPLAAAQVQQRLAGLTDQAIAIVLATEPDAAGAERIGTELAELVHTQPEALGRTLRVLAEQLLHGLPAELALALQPNLAALLEGLGAAFIRESCAILLSEQESIRGALVAELRAAEGKLRAARDDLEEQVERRTAELRSSEAQWRALVEGAPDLVALLDAQGRFLYANHTPQGAALPVSEIVGRCAWEGFQPDQQEIIRAALEQVFATGTPARHDLALPDQGGTTRWYSVRYAPLRRDGEVVAALVVARDITERKKREQMIELHLRNVAHELRSPLAKCQMSLELLEEKLESGGADGRNLHRYSSMALDNARRLVRMVDAILDLARLQAGGMAYHMERLSAADLVREAVLDMEPLASAKGLVLAAKVSGNLPPVDADRGQLDRVVRNLLDNAIKFTSQGQILVAVEGKEGEVEIAVSDSGCGILPEHLERVFDNFYQERAHFPGAGVGLPACRAIVAAHGGRIWAESDGRDRGTTVRFTLPLPGELQG